MKTLDELETGTLLRFRDGERGIKLGRGAAKQNGVAKVSYTGLSSNSNPDWNITGYIELSDCGNALFIQTFLDGKRKDGGISWTWEEPVPVEKMTLRQVCEALGKEIELIPEEE